MAQERHDYDPLVSFERDNIKDDYRLFSLIERPWVDTLKGSAFPNMKELRFSAADGVWWAAFAFDPKRRAVILVAADKSGVGEKKFYKSWIEKADSRFRRRLDRIN